MSRKLGPEDLRRHGGLEFAVDARPAYRIDGSPLTGQSQTRFTVISLS